MKKVLKIIGLCLVILIIVGAFLQVFGKGKVKPSSWFGGTESETVKVVNGVDGKDGADGKDGDTPYIGANGNWFIGGVDTGVKAVGQDGKDGKDGKDGETPYIGEDGNWYIGETNTGVAATLIVEPVNENLITENCETFFSVCYKQIGTYFVETPDKLSITADGGSDGRAYFSGNALGERLYRNTLEYGLKIETATEVSFEIDKPMTLYLWLDKVSSTGSSSNVTSVVPAVRIDSVFHEGNKVPDDERGYTISISLNAGKHTIRKGNYCVLSYLSLTA